MPRWGASGPAGALRCPVRAASRGGPHHLPRPGPGSTRFPPASLAVTVCVITQRSSIAARQEGGDGSVSVELVPADRGGTGQMRTVGQSFDALNLLAASPDVVRMPLVNGKLTLVHGRLWPALVRIADRFPAENLAAIHEGHTATAPGSSRPRSTRCWRTRASRWSRSRRGVRARTASPNASC